MKNMPMFPASLKQQEITKRIEDRIRPFVSDESGIMLKRPFTMYTFAVRTLTAMIDVLGDVASRYGITRIELYPQLVVYLSAKDSDEEKEGNLNVFFTMSDIRAHVEDMKEFLTTIRKQNGEEVTVLKLKNPSDKNEEKLMTRINTEATRDLQDKNAIIVMDTEIPTLVTSYYLAGMYDVLGEIARETGHSVMYNLGDVIEVSTIIRDGEPFYRILPGVCAKLTIKQDSFTEAD